jgi:hypothetical protein
MRYLLLLLSMFVGQNAMSMFQICGEDDRQYTTQYNGVYTDISYAMVQEKAKSVAWVAGCSGFLITDDLIVTNRHCDIQVNANVRMEYFLNSPVEANYRVAEVVERNRFDTTIVRVDGKPGKVYPKVELTTELPPVGDQIFILGFPGWGPMRIVGSNFGGAYDVSRVKHWADVLGGSSGSPIFDKHGRVFAMHNASSCYWRGYNSGYQIVWMAKDSPTLSRLLGL